MILYGRNINITRFMQSLSQVRQNRASERKAALLGKVEGGMNLRVNSEESVLRVGGLFVREGFKLDPRFLSYSSTEGERTLGTRLRDLPYLY